MLKQRTLSNSIRASGVGLHSGEKVNMTLRPAAKDTGIIFRRLDIEPIQQIPALAKSVIDTMLGTTIAKKNASVMTVEHILAAFAGLGIDNALIDLDGPEVPIMDGSSASFIFLIESAGIEEQNASKKFLRIKKNIRVEDGEKFAEFKPYNGYRISFEIDFDHPMIKSKLTKLSVDFSTLTFLKEISRARTFGFLKEIETLRSKNLALGGSLDNAIVFDDYRILNQDGLRYQDELVRHKILDVVGDLYLMGHILVGEFNGYKSGHELNNKLILKLYTDQTAWEEIEESEITDIPISYWTSALGRT
ncbi:MAG TPA: UDP-3-O-acyl-N-acetylglucosamine deacetylase [Gammaproteobacteria bacterium]|nr:UDP-3-O-acyl-N-acetylglucosamine deacetylase [Gammaproteobacteria bacterium]HIB24982.1 UDP-3-O-acyl-N-acetylglucosamine deacetylase [Gammaproteobacteria bacterium]